MSKFNENSKFDKNKMTRVPRVSLHKVNDLLQEEPEDILIKLQNPQFGLDLYLNAQSMSDELITSFTELLVKSLKCYSLREQISRLILKLVDSLFITKYLYALIIKKQHNEYNVQLLHHSLTISEAIFEMNPSNFVKIEHLKERMENIIKLKLNADNEELLNKFNEFEKMISKREDPQPIVSTPLRFNLTNQSFIDPPNTINTLNIIPKLDDLINDTNPFLRANIVQGPYRSVEHYLDVHFRLLREDFMQPLRSGINEIRALVAEYANNDTKSGNKVFLGKLKKIDSINVYFDVKMESSLLTNSGFVYSFKMSDEKKNQINWESSKRLMFGSLVCLSMDYFTNNFLIGVICERDTKRLMEGIVYIRFNNVNVSPSAEAFDLDYIQNMLPSFQQKYIMVETTAYFESYRHVLEALNSFYLQLIRDGEEHFPFKEHIVYARNQTMPMPTYALNTNIDFRYIII